MLAVTANASKAGTTEKVKGFCFMLLHLTHIEDSNPSQAYAQFYQIN